MPEGDDQVNSRWIRCPSCNKKTRTKVYKDTVMLRFPLYCPKCGSETIIDVMNFEYKVSAEPDA